MTGRSQGELLLLGAVWGASFLFMRMAAPEFGPLALVFVRVAGASLLLLPLLAWRGETGQLRQHWRPLLVVGLLNSALPFVCFSVAALVLGAGLMAVFNATAPIWGALIAWLWLGDTLGRTRTLGLAIGMVGVVGLAWGKASLQAGDSGISPALGIAASVAATVCYGLAANFTRKRLTGVAPLAVATGSQLAASALLLGPALWAWPTSTPSASAWWAAALLAVLCTGLAYLLYFRLIAHAGATQAMSVTFLIPGFAMAWAWLLVDETPTTLMLMGCAVILVGTALATGWLPRPRRAAP